MHYTGIDVQKTISTAVVIDDNEKVIDQLLNFRTDDEGLRIFMDRHPPYTTKVVFENLTAAHRVFHKLVAEGYDVKVLHTGNGCVTEISKTKFKTDLEDASKLAVICKDIFTGRRKYRLAHISSKDEMKAKSLCRMLNEFSSRRDEYNLKIQEYMNLNGLSLPGRLKSFIRQKALEFEAGSGHPALAMMARAVMFLNLEIEDAKKELERLYAGNDDIGNLMSMKGISIQTAATVYSAIDGIERFDSPEKLVSHFGLDLTRHDSGDSEGKRHISKQGDPLVRKLLANVVAKHHLYYPDSDLGQFYKRMKEKKSHWDAVTASMRKLTCIIWAMLYRHEPYIFNRKASQ